MKPIMARKKCMTDGSNKNERDAKYGERKKNDKRLK